jgi:tRNA (mo5U34)-methyltransferase
MKFMTTIAGLARRTRARLTRGRGAARASDVDEPHIDPAFAKDWTRSQIKKEEYWFHKIELAPDLITPGWNDPKNSKLPYFGLPANMYGMRVLDVGCCEGFFSFEAERRGAKEVIGIDPVPGSIRRLTICSAYLDSKVTGLTCNVYDLDPRTFGTFDMVFFFGVLYHLRHPLLALEKILSVCTGTLLMQTYSLSENDQAVDRIPEIGKIPMAKFYPFGVQSGPNKDIHDPTVFWIPNAEGAEAMLLSTGFQEIERLSHPSPLVFRAQSPMKSPGRPPDSKKAPWS